MGRKPAQKQASALRALVTITLDTTKLRAPGTVRKHYDAQRHFAKYRPRRILGLETWPDNVWSLRPYVHTQTASLSEVSTVGLRLRDQGHRKCQKHFDRSHLMCGSRKPRYFTASLRDLAATQDQNGSNFLGCEIVALVHQYHGRGNRDVRHLLINTIS